MRKKIPLLVLKCVFFCKKKHWVVRGGYTLILNQRLSLPLLKHLVRSEDTKLASFQTVKMKQTALDVE